MVHTAIGCNVAILAAKLGVFTLSGSSSILAESIHSMADISNQLLLRYGIVNSSRAPDERSNYGYRRELFVWSLISGVGIFCLGAGVSVVHGAHGLLHPAPLHDVWASLSVIGISMLIESYSLLVAVRALQEGAAARGLSVRAFVADGLDPTSTAVVAEDGGAVLGLALAGSCLLAAGGTGNSAFDALGSIAVGSLLGAVAAWLIQTNRRALVGRSLKRQQLEALLAALRADDVVSDVLDAKSEEIGPGVFRFKVEVEFCGDALVARYLSQPARRSELAQRFAAAASSPDASELDAALALYGRGLVHAVGEEVDRLEAIIRRVEPSVAHVDIEARACLLRERATALRR